MTTALVILAIALIALSSAAAVVVFRYMRKNSENEQRSADLNAKHRELQKKLHDLDTWEAKLKDQCRLQVESNSKRKHVYANFEVLDSEESKPTMRSIKKSLSSKIGYAITKEFPNISERHDDTKGGRTVYSVDFYVAPYDI